MKIEECVRGVEANERSMSKTDQATRARVQGLRPEDVESASFGPQDGCGCRDFRRDAGGISRAMVTKILRTIQANDELVTVDAHECIGAEVGDLVFIVYLASSGRTRGPTVDSDFSGIVLPEVPRRGRRSP
jgi:hypothetical protein